MKRTAIVIMIVTAIVLTAAFGDFHATAHTRQFLVQSSDLNSVVLFTPAVDGEYLVSIYDETLLPSPARPSCYQLEWTDDIKAQNTNFNDCAGGPFYFSSTTRLIHVKGGTDVKISETDFGLSTTPRSYSIFITATSVK